MIIGLAGLAGSGKDTFAAALPGFTRIRLADPLKSACADWFGWTDEQLNGPSHLREQPDPAWDGLTPRRALQFLGTEVGRALHPDVWVRAFLRAATRATVLGECSDIVCPDCRFQNEVDAIREAGGVVLHLQRPGRMAGAHSSESGQARLTGYAGTVINDGSLDQWVRVAVDAVDTLRAGGRGFVMRSSKR